MTGDTIGPGSALELLSRLPAEDDGRPPLLFVWWREPLDELVRSLVIVLPSR